MPVLIPQWALGWHHSRQGIRSIGEMGQIVQNFTDYNLPLDAIWSDVDYMSNYDVFTVDPIYYGTLGTFVDTLHSDGKRFVPIIESGIAIKDNGTYASYNEGIALDIFIKAANGEVFVG